MADSTDFLKQQLHTLRQTVGYLRERAAAVGGEVFLPPGDRHSLYQARAEIAVCKVELRTRGVEVDDEPEDDAPPAAQGEPAQQPPPVPQVAATNSDSAGNRGAQGVFHAPVTINNSPVDQVRASGVFQLRAPVADFVGRDAELERLVGVLRPGQGGRAAAISGVRGMGGLGKTELAYAAAAQLRDDYPDGQILLELAGASNTPLSPAQALQQVIRAFRPEDTLPEELPALQLLYRSALAGRRILVLADDARDAAQVRLLQPPPGSALLVTSRQRFTLDGMTPVDLERLEEGAAIILLRGICPRLTEEQARQIARLCAFLPLALRISAGILLNDSALPVERYLSRLADEHQRLVHLKDPDDPTLDVRANLLLSYAALDKHMQAIFRRLGVLAADADLALIAAVLELSEEQANEVLRSLLRRSLVEYDAARDRWGMHDLVRACALELLVEDGDVLPVRAPTLMERLRLLFQGTSPPAREDRTLWLRYARQVIALIDHAARRYQAGGDGVLEGLSLFDRERTHLDAVRAWLWAQPPAADIDMLVIQEVDATIFIGDLRDPLRTVRVPQLERALAVARRRGDQVGESRALGNLGNVYRDLGEVQRAIELFVQDLAIARKLGNRAEEGRALGNLGNVYRDLGEVQQAIELYQQRLAIAREVGNRAGEGITLGNLGNAYADLGEMRRAIELYEQHLAIAREQGYRAGEGRALGNLATAYRDMGEVRRAIELYQQRLAIARELGDRRGEGRALANLATAYRDMGETQRVRELYEQRLAIAREVSDRHGEGRALANLGTTFFLLGDAAQARSYCEAALGLARELEARSLEGAALRDLANALAALDQPTEADACYVQSLAIHDELGDQGEATRTRWTYGQFLLTQGERERGLALLDACVAYEQQIGHAQAAEHTVLVEQLRADGAQPG